MADISRSFPNILITGTPGVGKSLLSRILCRKTGLTCIEVSDFAIEKGCLLEYDEVYECPILDEEKLLDEMEDLIYQGGMIVDYHGCDFFPHNWFDIVFVLRTDNTILYDRLKERGYTGRKLDDNIQCEIFQIILEQARTTFEGEIIHELVQYASVLKNVANSIFETGGFIRKIENWGDKQLPCVASAHGITNTHARHFMICFDIPPSQIRKLEDDCGRNISIIRASVYKQNIPPKNIQCTWEEEMLPPPYRPSVLKLLEQAKKHKRYKSQFKYNSALNYYPFLK